jgi:large subunit ribosomal protein L17
MPTNSNKSRKLQRTKAQREALIRSLTISLIENRSIETTMPKAKTVRPFAEKLISKAKIGDLHNRRLIISRLHSIKTTSILVDEIAPALKDRDSGYLRIKKSDSRLGDNAPMAVISFVDDTTKKAVEAPKKKPAAKSVAKKAEVKPAPSKAKAKKAEDK